jgi:hypothetical protein
MVVKILNGEDQILLEEELKDYIKNWIPEYVVYNDDGSFNHCGGKKNNKTIQIIKENEQYKVRYYQNKGKIEYEC